MSLNLYEINSELLALMEQVDPDTGELPEETADEIMALIIAQRDKAESVALYIKSLKAEASAIKDEEQTLVERRKLKENKAQRLSDRLLSAMNISDFDKLETAKVKVGVRKSKRVEVVDFGLIPAEFKRIKTTEEADKVKIANALKSGGTVNGAVLLDTQSLQIK